MTQKWQNNEISNYEYLIYLNQCAYRSFYDLTQYPVFPWIIQDYESTQLNLNDNKTFRDLSKPIGALNPVRLVQFKERYEMMPKPKFLYGTHYSSPGYVIGYLLRKYPQYMLRLQGGRFDKPDRLFFSIKKDWRNVFTNPASVKELIPEFYGQDDAFLVNYLKLDLGQRQNNKFDVKLPKWAKSPIDFLNKNRQALESDYVSNNLHLWIDLIFGYRQRGSQAVDANNGSFINLVFHPNTYEGVIDLNQILDPIERKGLRTQINEFGQTPKQLFKINHLPKNYYRKINQEISFQFDNKKANLLQEQKNSLLTAIFQKQNIGLFNVQKLHSGQINQCKISNLGLYLNDSILSIGSDGFLKQYNFDKKLLQKQFKVSDLSLSCMVIIKEPNYIAVQLQLKDWFLGQQNIYFQLELLDKNRFYKRGS